ncbi:MAG: multi-sensor hybrid histidine kinase [Bacteroidetes bacterium]|jgi:PAS domain S-box-containing protein|nr:multi-sensor hybrid histidine kinase [Bacteroidota bacterium]
MSQASILVVEDEHIVAKDIASRLTRRGYRVVAIAATAGEAVEEAGRHRPDLVLMDIMLKGDVDGITAADRIRDLYGLPIVYLTAYADDSTLQRAKVTDAFGYILKPFEERELSITIEMALYKHRMEARLRESERWLATTLRSIGDAIIAADTRGAITFMNPVAEQLTGWTHEEAMGRQLAEVFQTAFEPDESRRGGTTILVGKTGKHFPVEESAAPIKDDRGETSGIVVVFRDVTDQRRAEDALRLSEARTAGIIASAMDAIITVDSTHRIVVFNAAAEQMFKCSAAEAAGKDIEVFIPERFRASHQKHMDEFGASGVTKRRLGGTGSIVGQRADGTEFPIEASISQIETRGERLYTVIIRDITERRKAEHDLRESEERYRRFFEDDLTGDFIARADGTLLDCNPAFARILGFPSVVSAMQCNALSLYTSPEAREAFFEVLRTRGRVEEYELDLVRPDGQMIHVVTNAIATMDDDGQLVEYKGYMYDITERKKLEEQVRQSHKMESIGTLASGIAHDFNNILNNVIGFVLQIKKHAHEPEKVLKYSATIEKSATRGAELSAQLLSFARKAKRESVSVNVAHIVDEVYSLCGETFPRSITVTRHVDDNIRTILGDHGELYQVLLNLCVNARDAILARGGSASGIISLGVHNGRVGDRVSAHMLSSTAEHYVEIRVSDNGIGIPAAIRERIFDPFFTTKERGRGTGLGLSVVYSIVRNHRGIILVDSEEGAGTTFHIYFSAVDGAPHNAQVNAPAVASSRSHETVLIVDDEESMQELGRELLEEQGYTVLIASTGQEAVDLFKQCGHEIGLVVLDLVMPGMDGGQTYIELKKMQPELKAFFCTGYMPDQVITALLEEEHLQAIQKPFNPEAFVQLVRDVLDGRR